MEIIIMIMVAIIKAFTKGTSCTIVQEKFGSEKDFNKGRIGNRCPYIGQHFVIRNTMSGYCLGTDYANSLANAHNRMSGDTMSGSDVQLKPTWHVAFPSTPEYDFGAWFEKKKSEENGFESTAYLKVQINENQIAHKYVTEYFLNGELVTDEETLADIESWKKSKGSKQSSTQTDLGMNKQHEQHYLLPELATIKSITMGDKVLNIADLISEYRYALAAVAAR
jgi:hypothetical protein